MDRSFQATTLLLMIHADLFLFRFSASHLDQSKSKLRKSKIKLKLAYVNVLLSGGQSVALAGSPQDKHHDPAASQVYTRN
jgi:hypothetical protein